MADQLISVAGPAAMEDLSEEWRDQFYLRVYGSLSSLFNSDSLWRRPGVMIRFHKVSWTMEDAFGKFINDYDAGENLVWDFDLPTVSLDCLGYCDKKEKEKYSCHDRVLGHVDMERFEMTVTALCTFSVIKRKRKIGLRYTFNMVCRPKTHVTNFKYTAAPVA